MVAGRSRAARFSTQGGRFTLRTALRRRTDRSSSAFEFRIRIADKEYASGGPSSRFTLPNDRTNAPGVGTIGFRREQLRFDAERTLAMAATADFRRRRARRVDVTTDDRDLSISLEGITRDMLQAASADKALMRAWNRAMKNFARTVQARARKLSRIAYETGLFSSSWKAVVQGSGVRLRILLTNRAPYARYVHASGTARSSTVIETRIKPMLRQSALELQAVFAQQVQPMLVRSIERQLIEATR